MNIWLFRRVLAIICLWCYIAVGKLHANDQKTLLYFTFFKLSSDVDNVFIRKWLVALFVIGTRTPTDQFADKRTTQVSQLLHSGPIGQRLTKRLDWAVATYLIEVHISVRALIYYDNNEIIQHNKLSL